MRSVPMLPDPMMAALIFISNLVAETQRREELFSSRRILCVFASLRRTRSFGGQGKRQDVGARGDGNILPPVQHVRHRRRDFGARKTKMLYDFPPKLRVLR